MVRRVAADPESACIPPQLRTRASKHRCDICDSCARVADVHTAVACRLSEFQGAHWSSSLHRFAARSRSQTNEELASGDANQCDAVAKKAEAVLASGRKTLANEEISAALVRKKRESSHHTFPRNARIYICNVLLVGSDRAASRLILRRTLHHQDRTPVSPGTKPCASSRPASSQSH